MTNIELMNYWIESSDRDYDTMIYMKNGQKNTWCLFMGQLLIEKLLKAIYAKNNKSAPYAPKSHDLLYLARDVLNLTITEHQSDLLDTITKFNMDARYDDYKNKFYNICTDEYTEEQLKNIEEVREWLKKELQTNQ